MKKLAIALSLLLLSVAAAIAQTVTRQPGYVSPQAWSDVGNGPAEIMMLEGGAAVYTALGSGVGSTSGSATALTLTAVPSVAPCVGCIISGAGITSGTTVLAFNGVTSITLSAAMTVAASTPVAWGAACPTSGAPNGTSGLGAPANIRATAGAVDYGVPFYTQARLCVYGGYQPASYVTYAIGAH